MKTLNPCPFFLSLFFLSFRLDFIQSLSRLEFTDGVPFDTAPEKNTAHERKEASCERAKKRSLFFFRARLKRDEEENKNVESNDGVGIGIVVGERSLAGEPTER